jgi:ElaB/YqjD/DUF883 family membrane-anchored ribosome-binding protein
MIRMLDRVVTDQQQRARDELAEAWDHLAAAAGHGARRIGDVSRQRTARARERAALAASALRGEVSPAPWRWLAVGLAAGVVIGAAGAAVLARRRCGADQLGAEQPEQPEQPEQTGSASSPSPAVPADG